MRLLRAHAPAAGSAEAGFTLAELVMVAAVLVTLAAVALPVAKFTARRSKEAELRQALRRCATPSTSTSATATPA